MFSAQKLTFLDLWVLILKQFSQRVSIGPIGAPWTPMGPMAPWCAPMGSHGPPWGKWAPALHPFLGSKRTPDPPPWRLLCYEAMWNHNLKCYMFCMLSVVRALFRWGIWTFLFSPSRPSVCVCVRAPTRPPGPFARPPARPARSPAPPARPPARPPTED